MKPSTKTKLIRIGNSRGVRIPKSMIEQLGLEGDLTLDLRPDGLLIRPVSSARAGWAEQFQAMASRGDDRLLDAVAPDTTCDKEQWELQSSLLH